MGGKGQIPDLNRIEEKLDLILNIFGLGDNRVRTPVEVKDEAHKIVVQFEARRLKKGADRERPAC